MKLIDLLNKIVKGEEIPKSFMYNNYIFNLGDDKRYRDQEGDYLVEHISYNFKNLNDKIQILEDKKIVGLTNRSGENYDKKLKDIYGKINEIINHINKEDK